MVHGPAESPISISTLYGFLGGKSAVYFHLLWDLVEIWDIMEDKSDTFLGYGPMMTETRINQLRKVVEDTRGEPAPVYEM